LFSALSASKSRFLHHPHVRTTRTPIACFFSGVVHALAHAFLPFPGSSHTCWQANAENVWEHNDGQIK
jgi:hypothetical protein